MWGGVEQALVVKEIDENGRPVKWGYKDKLNSEFELVHTATLEEDVANIEVILPKPAKEIFVSLYTKVVRTDGVEITKSTCGGDIRINPDVRGDAMVYLARHGNFHGGTDFRKSYTYALMANGGAVCLQWLVLDGSNASGVVGTSVNGAVENIEKVRINPEYMYVSGEVVGRIAAGSTIEVWAR